MTDFKESVTTAAQRQLEESQKRSSQEVVGAIAMPQYVSHKKVSALQIMKREGNTLFFMDRGYSPIHVEEKLFSRYSPVCGDYYIVYPDGYTSISPQRVFEEGYARA